MLVNKFRDSRGSLLSFLLSELPFTPCRIYVLNFSDIDIHRGGHAHYNLKQMLVCLKGRVELAIEKDGEQQSVILSEGDTYLILPISWRDIKSMSSNCSLMVICDQPYDETDYIRDYKTFKSQRINDDNDK